MSGNGHAREGFTWLGTDSHLRAARQRSSRRQRKADALRLLWAGVPGEQVAAETRLSTKVIRALERKLETTTGRTPPHRLTG